MKYLKMIVLFLARIRIGLSFSLFIALAEFFFFFWFFRSTRTNIPNGCLDAYEVKVYIDIFKYQEKVKLISQF